MQAGRGRTSRLAHFSSVERRTPSSGPSFSLTRQSPTSVPSGRSWLSCAARSRSFVVMSAQFFSPVCPRVLPPYSCSLQRGRTTGQLEMDGKQASRVGSARKRDARGGGVGPVDVGRLAAVVLVVVAHRCGESQRALWDEGARATSRSPASFPLRAAT